MLESAAANWLAAVGRAGDEWAIAAADISTGRFELVACGTGELAAELARLSPAETIAGIVRARHRAPRAGKGGFDSLAGERALKSRFGLATLDGIGGPTRAELAAAGGLLAYLDATQKGAGILLDAPRRVSRVGAHGDRFGDPRQPRTVPLGFGQRRGKPARRDRPLPVRPPAGACSRRTSPRR